MKVHIFIFRRDLRIEDNRGLNEAMKRGNVLPIFIFDPKQINPAENPYFRTMIAEVYVKMNLFHALCGNFRILISDFT